MKFAPSAVKFAAFLLLSIGLLTHAPAHAAIRREWVQHWDGGFPAKTNDAVAVQLDSKGNLYVAGSAANSSNLTDYVTLKYAPNGTLLWSRRYGGSNGLTNIPRAMALDTNDNVYLTGTSVTVKYSSTGEELWTDAQGGRSIAVSGTNIYVAGFSDTQFATKRMTATGTNLWTRVFKYEYGHGPDVAQALAIAPGGGVRVAGEVAYFYYRLYDPDVLVALLEYSVEGVEKYHAVSHPQAIKSTYPCSIHLDNNGRTYITYNDHLGMYSGVSEFNASGIWQRTQPSIYYAFSSRVIGGFFGVIRTGFGQFKLDYYQAPGLADFSLREGPPFPSVPNLLAAASAVDTDRQGNVVATGYFLTNNIQDAGVFHFDQAGSVDWYDRYNGAANGNDEGKAIVASLEGVVYVAGVSTTPQGGTEIILIKYSEYTAIETKPGGGVLLQFPGTPAQQYKVQATTNFPNWLDIGLGTATTNGILQFEDTNATKYPFRFYQTVTR